MNDMTALQHDREQVHKTLAFSALGVPPTHGALPYHGSEGALSMALLGIKIVTTWLVYEYFLIVIQKELQTLNTLSIHTFTVSPHSLKASNRLVLIMSMKGHPTICFMLHREVPSTLTSN
jgi:hypothetical protein